jgi:integrase/recombinase XerD
VQKRTTDPLSVLIRGYDDHLFSNRGASEKTRELYGGYGRDFLTTTFHGRKFNPGALDRSDILRFVKRCARRYKPKTMKLVTTSLRSVLRFLTLRGVCAARLVEAVPTLPCWKLAALPPSLTDDELRRFLVSFDRKTACGQRGYAIVACMVFLGLRADEVARLHLDDIDWDKGILRITVRKSRRSSHLPLPKRVGRALVAYIRGHRPVPSERMVFVRHIHSRGGALNSRAIRSIVRGAFRRAGVKPPSQGSHILRHTAATQMIRKGATLKDVADVLRHRSLMTTAIYTKVDLPTLRRVAMPWPEVCS